MQFTCSRFGAWLAVVRYWIISISDIAVFLKDNGKQRDRGTRKERTRAVVCCDVHVERKPMLKAVLEGHFTGL